MSEQTMSDKPGPKQYRRKPEVVDAVQWHKPGDHPDVVMVHVLWCVPVGRGGTRIWIEPGDWIISHEDGRTSLLSDKAFEAAYEPADAATGPGGATRKVLEAAKSILKPSTATVYAYCSNDGVAIVASDLRAALRECGIEVEP